VGPNEDGDCGFEFDNDADSDDSDEAAGNNAKEIEIDDI
jgi:translation initiation factor 1A